ncbi:helix-turn-helix domain-containing protein [Bacillus cereus group sp. BfR-BA-01315]|uniref:helix-turn-helix domain-containing protein n=1 Tax=Bacillus cereus group sp. BfR-BA-01315 TaxID=2920292 RepID=UPI001F58CD93|nr:hypothetical protein [Bacillus cereus group sp. BfR-BA-01315]
MKPDKKEVGSRIKYIKENYRPPVSLNDFGNLLVDQKGEHISRGTLNSWMRGLAYPPHYLVEQIAELGGTTPDWIYWGSLRNFISAYINENKYDEFIHSYPETISMLEQYFQDRGYDNEKIPELSDLNRIFERKYRPKFIEYIEGVSEPYTSQIPNYLFDGIAYEGPKGVQQNKFLELVKQDILNGKGEKVVWGEKDKVEAIAKEKFEEWVQQYERNKKHEEEENSNILSYLIENTKDEKGVQQILSNIAYQKRFHFYYDTNLSDEIVQAFINLGKELEEINKHTDSYEKKRTFKDRTINVIKGWINRD